MTLSQLSADNVKSFLRVDISDDDALIGAIIDAATSFVCGYTGLTPAEAEMHPDLTLAALCLCGEMYDNRVMTCEEDKLNPTAKAIMDMHSVHLLGREDRE